MAISGGGFPRKVTGRGTVPSSGFNTVEEVAQKSNPVGTEDAGFVVGKRGEELVAGVGWVEVVELEPVESVPRQAET